jgi:hypothetical protein
MPTISSDDRARAEILALRFAVLALLSTVERAHPGLMVGLKEKVMKGESVLPSAADIPAKDQMIRDRLLALLDEAAQQR